MYVYVVMKQKPDKVTPAEASTRSNKQKVGVLNMKESQELY